MIKGSVQKPLSNGRSMDIDSFDFNQFANSLQKARSYFGIGLLSLPVRTLYL